MDFRAEERQHLVERSRALLGFAVLFYPALYPLDRLLMAEADANLIGIIRLAIAAVFLATLGLVRTGFGQRHILPISLAYALIASLGICLFGLIDTPWSSPYFVGLIMVMFGACLFLPWSLGPAAFFCGASIGIWGAANLAAEPFSAVGAGPAIFLSGSAVIAVLATHLNAVGRWRRFETGRKLAELTEARTRFFANVSHELRTPLMLLLGPLQELRERQDDPLLQAMESNARRLQRQVELLLDAARLEDGRVGVDARHGRLDVLVESLVDAARPFAEREGIRLEVDLEPLHGRYDADHAGVGTCCASMAWVRRQQGEPAAARSWLEKAARAFEKAGNRRGLAGCLNDLADLDRANGRLKRAEQRLHRARELYLAVGRPTWVPEINLGLVLVAQQRHGEARAVLEPLARFLQQRGRSALYLHAGMGLTPALAGLRDWGALDTWLDSLETELERTGVVDADLARAAGTPCSGM